MDEKKKMLVLFGIVIATFLAILIGSICEGSSSKKYLNEFYSALNGSENKLVMIGRDNCSWCQMFKPSLDFMHDNYGLDYIYVNTNELTSSTFNKMLKDIKVDPDSFGTPLTVVVSNGEVVDSLNGFTDEVDLFDFLKKYDFIDQNAELKLNYVDYNGYKKVISSDEASILVIGQTTCGYCIKAKPILNQIAIDKNVVINYLNMTKLSDSEKEKFTTKLDYFKDNPEWGTPLTLIVKNGEVIDSANGLLDYDGYVDLFSRNGLIKQVLL